MNTILHILLVPVFFPSVTFGILSAEIFPWAMLFAVVSIRRIHRKGALTTAILFFILSCSALWSMTFNSGGDVVRSLAAYVNAIAIFVAILNMPDELVGKAIRLAKVILILLIILGLLQYSGSLYFLDSLLSFFVPRASSGALQEMASRGVTLLSSEPSRAGVELIYLYILYRFTEHPGMGVALRDIGLILYLAFVIRAAQPMAFGLFSVSLFFLHKPRRIFFMMLVVLMPFVFFSFGDSHIINSFGGSRVITLVNDILDQDDLAEALFFVVNESGHRLLTIYSFFLFGFHHPVGLGVGMWPVASVQALNETGIDLSQFRYFIIHGGGEVVSVRGSGVLSNMMLDIGILGSAFFLYWILRITDRFRIGDMTSFLVMLILLVKISFIGSVGEPLPWVVTALILRDNVKRKTYLRADQEVHQPQHNGARQLA